MVTDIALTDFGRKELAVTETEVLCVSYNIFCNHSGFYLNSFR